MRSAVLELGVVGGCQHGVAGRGLLADGFEGNVVGDLDEVAEREIHRREQIERGARLAFLASRRKPKLQNLSHVTLTVGESP